MKLSQTHKQLFSEIFKKIIFFLIFLSICYSVSYQQFKHFDLNDTRGLSDAKSYVEMSNNNYYVSQTHRYRFLIPKTVEILRPYIGHLNTFSVQNKETKKMENDRIIFYLINLIVISLTTYLLFIFMQLINFNIYESFIGGILFITSRGIIAITGAPMIDSLQYLAIIFYCICITKDQINKLAIFSPFLILTKETMIPVLFIPLFRRKSKRLKYLLGLVISLIVLVISRNNIYSSLDPIKIGSELNELNIFQNFYQHSLRFGYNLSQLFTLKGFHTLIYTYGIFFIASFLGYFIYQKDKNIYIPNSVKILLPYSIFLGFISRDIGRMLLISFPIIIPLSVITLSKTFQLASKNKNN